MFRTVEAADVGKWQAGRPWLPYYHVPKGVWWAVALVCVAAGLAVATAMLRDFLNEPDPMSGPELAGAYAMTVLVTGFSLFVFLWLLRALLVNPLGGAVAEVRRRDGQQPWTVEVYVGGVRRSEAGAPLIWRFTDRELSVRGLARITERLQAGDHPVQLDPDVVPAWAASDPSAAQLATELEMERDPLVDDIADGLEEMVGPGGLDGHSIAQLAALVADQPMGAPARTGS
jgi:hypothetical protein